MVLRHPTQDPETQPADVGEIVNGEHETTKADLENNGRNDYRFRVRLLIKHPRYPKDVITQALSLEPTNGHTAGHERRTPKNNLLPGRHHETMWQRSFNITGRKRFFEPVSEILVQIEDAAAFLLEVRATGGTATLILDLPGDINMGSVLRWSDLQRLAHLQIDLSVEVFPEYP